MNLFLEAAHDYCASYWVKSFKGTAQLQRIARYGWCAAIVLWTMGASSCFAVNPSIEYLNAEVESISYQGNNNYKVDITVYNGTSNSITMKEHNAFFYVQTEVLGRWEELSAFVASPVGSALLPPCKGLRMAYILYIPLTIPSLYRNSEGDFNMRFKYLIRFVAGSKAGLRSNSGESSYWITPKTDTWILREGM
ncbi:MAG: hypothetical protein HZA17_03755 [Nitrospirae bacterium]|nr:hypothetical protein [Nitrospirota bacterium]